MISCQELYLRIAPDKFHYLKFILEGYDNLSILSSFNMKKGVVVMRYLSSSERDVFKLITALAGKLV